MTDLLNLDLQYSAITNRYDHVPLARTLIDPVGNRHPFLTSLDESHHLAAEFPDRLPTLLDQRIAGLICFDQFSSTTETVCRYR